MANINDGLTIGEVYRFEYNGRVREAVILEAHYPSSGCDAFYRTYCRLSGGLRTFKAHRIKGVAEYLDSAGPLDNPDGWDEVALKAANLLFAN